MIFRLNWKMLGAPLVVLVVKKPPAKAGDIRDMGLIPGSGRSPGGGHGNPCILAWRIPWTEEPGGLQSIWLQRVGFNWATEHTRIENADLICSHAFITITRKVVILMFHLILLLMIFFMFTEKTASTLWTNSDNLLGCCILWTVC